MSSDLSSPPLEDETPTKRRSRAPRFAIVLALVLGALAIWRFAGSERPSTVAGSEPDQTRAANPLRLLPVSTTEAQPQESYTVTDRFLGRVEAARESELGFELAGTLTTVAVEEGASIETGQELARLDTARLDARKGELNAALAQASATETLALTTLDRIRSAVARNAISRQELDEAQEQVDRSAAAANRIRAQLQAIEVDLDKSVLRAPFPGTVAVRFVDEGTIVTAGQPILHLLETGRFEIRAGLSARAAHALATGDPVEVFTREGQSIVAEASRLLPQRNDRTRTVDLILEPRDPDVAIAKSLRHGDLVEVGIEHQIDTAGYWLPRSSLTESVRGLWAAYVLNPTDEAGTLAGVYALEKRQLEVLDQVAEQVFVRGALYPGEKVVTGGLHRLSPGQRVIEASPSPDPRASLTLK